MRTPAQTQPVANTGEMLEATLASGHGGILELLVPVVPGGAPGASLNSGERSLMVLVREAPMRGTAVRVRVLLPGEEFVLVGTIASRVSAPPAVRVVVAHDSSGELLRLRSQAVREDLARVRRHPRVGTAFRVAIDDGKSRWLTRAADISLTGMLLRAYVPLGHRRVLTMTLDPRWWRPSLVVRAWVVHDRPARGLAGVRYLIDADEQRVAIERLVDREAARGQ